MFFFQAEDGIRDLVRSRGLGDVYKRQCRGLGEQADQFAQLPRPAKDLWFELNRGRRNRACRGRRAESLNGLNPVPPVSYTHLTLPTSDLV